jgi:hypothetical protein
MGWRDLLQQEEMLTAPWIGGRVLRRGPRSWAVEGKLPPEHGWQNFRLASRKATVVGLADPDLEMLCHHVMGYLVGDRLIPDGIWVDPNPAKIINFSERVWLVEPGLDRFVRISAGRTHEGGSLVYKGQEMPLGPENDVLSAYLDQKPSVADIPGVSPALDAAFRMETWRRAEIERHRVEAERRRREEEERRAKEERRQQLVKQLGDGAGRREMAKVDFAEAAKAALAIGGAVFVDHRHSPQRNEMIVRYRLDGRRFECTCDSRTMQIIDAGVCLTAHDDDPDFEEGTRGDSFFTLESLPSVIRQAEREGHLVVFRHA